MKRIPAYLFRNMDVTVAGDEKIGQVPEFMIPDIKQKTEKLRNAGMNKERMIFLGLEVGDCEFKMSAYDPATLKLFGIGIGRETEIVLTKAMADEDGVYHSAVVTVRGRMHELKTTKLEPGKMGGTDYKFAVDYLHIEIDGGEVLEIDDYTHKVDGVDQLADMKRALLRA